MQQALVQPLRRVFALLRRAYVLARRFIEYVFFERPSGIETAKTVTLEELGWERTARRHYEPSSWHVLERVLLRHEVGENDVFIDFGCGKGRVLIQAARYPFKRVIGVELSAPLAEVARVNIDRCLPQLLCKDIQVINADAVAYEIPDDVSVVYLNNPFQNEIFSALVRNLLASLERRPRQIRIIYTVADESDQLLRAGAVLERTVCPWRPTRRWALESAIYVYRLGPAAPAARDA